MPVEIDVVTREAGHALAGPSSARTLHP
jgi:hypothetical protein